MTIADKAAEYLRKEGHAGIMHGDVMLTHEILTFAGRPHRGYRSNKLLLNALEGSPLFEKHLTYIGRRIVRDFRLVPISPSP